MKRLIHIPVGLILLAVFVAVFIAIANYIHEKTIFNQILVRLKADSRTAEVMVTKVEYDPKLNKNFTTIKFLEYDAQGKPLNPKYFTFSGNIIQFQALVIRFNDDFVERGDKLRGKSAYIFWKVFMLNGPSTEEFIITPLNSVPTGYKIPGMKDYFERNLWRSFWRYALSRKDAVHNGVKNAQIEAPGTAFVPGTIYTIKIEHNGGLRIDTTPLPEIVKGEKIPVAKP
jgi:hypothetical protein